MGHIFKKRFAKTSRKVANRNSNSTIQAKKLLREMDKEGKIGTEKIKKK